MKTVKYLFESKTVVFNLIVALAGVVAFFWTPANEWVQSNAVLIMAIVGAANVVLRRVTKDAYAFFPIIVAMLCLMMLPSCVSPQYKIDTRPYTKQIEADPGNVIVDKEHITPIGGFQTTIGGTVITDQGEVTVSPDGVSGNVVVDLRSGK